MPQLTPNPGSFTPKSETSTPVGFELVYGPPPDPKQHRGVRPLVGGAVEGTVETLQAAQAYYEQNRKGFDGIIDETAAPNFHALMQQVREVISPTFGKLVAFRAHGRIYCACVETLIEDGSDPNSPMRGARPLIFNLDYIAENPDAIDEVGSTLVADLVNRGIAVGGPLTGKLPRALRRRNAELLAEGVKNPGSLPIIAGELPPIL